MLDIWLVNTWAKLKQKRNVNRKTCPHSIQPFMLLCIADIFVSYDFFKIISSSTFWPSICHIQNFIFIKQISLPTYKFPVVTSNSLKFVDNQIIIKFRTHLRIIIMYKYCRHAENYFVFSSPNSLHPEYCTKSWRNFNLK